jgi:hypothetical protein
MWLVICSGNHYKGDPAFPKHQSKLKDDDEYQLASNSLLVAFVGACPHSLVNENWILFDNQSFVHIFKSHNMVDNHVHVPLNKGIIIHSNSGRQYTNQIATHPDVRQVWFNLSVITNIYSSHSASVLA